VTAWVEAAGGSVDGDAALLPADLPQRLALTELQNQARIAGLAVREVPRVDPVPLCVECERAAAEPGDGRCAHCIYWAPPLQKIAGDNSLRRVEEAPNPLGCIHCGQPCPPSDLAESIPLGDGRWKHLSCSVRQMRAGGGMTDRHT
jgi:hypothetical protein